MEDVKIVNKKLVDIYNGRITFQSQHYKHWNMVFNKFDVSNKDTKVELNCSQSSGSDVFISNFKEIPLDIYLFKVNNRKARKWYEISSKLRLKRLEQLY